MRRPCDNEHRWAHRYDRYGEHKKRLRLAPRASRPAQEKSARSRKRKAMTVRRSKRSRKSETLGQDKGKARKI
jgi:hypothetical protein